MQTLQLDPAKLLGFRLAVGDLVADDKAATAALGAKLGNKPGAKVNAKLGAKFGSKTCEARPLDPAPDQA